MSKNPKLFSVKNIEQVQNRIGRKYWFYKGDDLYRYRLGGSNGPYQTRNLQMLRHCKPNAHTIIDVGSNIGTNTIEYATWANTVESFEPMRNNFHLCKKNVALARKTKLQGTYFNRKTQQHEHNPDKPDGWWKVGDDYASLDICAKINFYNVALGEKAGTVKMAQKTSEYSRGDAVVANGSWKKYPTSKIEMVTLDSYNFKKVDIIKIDVEGYELQVLKGAKKTIKKHTPVVQCELRETHTKRFGYKSNDLIDFVQKLGNYILCDFNGTKLDKDHLSNKNSVMDVFFVPKDIYDTLDIKRRTHKGMKKVPNLFSKLFKIVN